MLTKFLLVGSLLQGIGNVGLTTMQAGVKVAKAAYEHPHMFSLASYGTVSLVNHAWPLSLPKKAATVGGICTLVYLTQSQQLKAFASGLVSLAGLILPAWFLSRFFSGKPEKPVSGNDNKKDESKKPGEPKVIPLADKPSQPDTLAIKSGSSIKQLSEKVSNTASLKDQSQQPSSSLATSSRMITDDQKQKPDGTGSKTERLHHSKEKPSANTHKIDFSKLSSLVKTAAKQIADNQDAEANKQWAQDIIDRINLNPKSSPKGKKPSSHVSLSHPSSKKLANRFGDSFWKHTKHVSGASDKKQLTNK